MQPDLGRMHDLGTGAAGDAFRGGVPVRYLACILLIVIAVIPLAVNFGLKPYQQDRITAFVHPDIDQQGASWAINQSLIAIGSGGWSGKGFKAPNTQIELGFLPATAIHNDYIFSAIGEQWGFVGGMFLIGAFALAAADLSVRRFFCQRSVWIAARHRGYCAHFHAYFPERRHDHRVDADYRRAIATHQLQRVLCSHDHVWPWNRE